MRSRLACLLFRRLWRSRFSRLFGSSLLFSAITLRTLQHCRQQELLDDTKKAYPWLDSMSRHVRVVKDELLKELFLADDGISLSTRIQAAVLVAGEHRLLWGFAL